ncbi:MAG: ATP-grasp domain-containing protein [Sterolibacteriaceae bacterium]|nr:ATP-grasp domain-containing protein [Candidatus Methylophosphatis haderslevensis]
MRRMLIVATSGRALAQCAARSGYASVVLDCFADADTRVTAKTVRRVADDSGIRFDAERLLSTAEQFAPPAEIDAIIYGAGFESEPALLENFAQRYRVCGNSSDVIRQVKHPETFHRLLDQIGLPYPETRLDPPESPDGWLVKRIGGTGGQEVQRCGARPFEPGRDCVQKAAPGVVCSALFLADKRRGQIIGFSEALPPGNGAGWPFAYGGAVSRVEVSPEIRAELSSKVNQLVALAGLVGLNGIDFVVDRDAFWVLEVNPRPTATLELYDPDFADGLLAAHVAVCLGEPIRLEQVWGPVRGHAIVFAPTGFRVPPYWQPESWCSDIPCPDVPIAPGMPICSVRATGSSRADVFAKLSGYRAAVLASHDEAIA